MRTAFTAAALNGGSCQLRSRSSCGPWNNPQSTSTRARSHSIKYFDPVTEPAAPQNESVGMRRMVADVVSEPRAVATGSSGAIEFIRRAACEELSFSSSLSESDRSGGYPRPVGVLTPFPTFNVLAYDCVASREGNQ